MNLTELEKESESIKINANDTQAIITSFLTRVYGWMAFALVITALSAFAVANSSTMLELVFGGRYTILALIAVELGLVFAITGLMNKVSSSVLSMLFVAYSLINGITLSSILLIYTFSSIASTFAICALTFGAMSVLGLVTKKDLSFIGRICIFALIGIIIASIVNFFVASSTADWIISYIGVAIFIGLTAYDTQKLKALALASEYDDEQSMKMSIYGALSLYLDFINLFIYLLRIFGSRK